MSRRKSRAAVVATAAAAVAGVATAAVAYYAFTSTSAPGTVTAGSLSAAGAPAAAATGPTSVTVSWTRPAANLDGAQFVVTNTVDNHTACTVAATTTPASCPDTAALPGVVNTYSIRTTLPGATWTTSATTFQTPAATPHLLVVTRASGAAIGAQTAGTAFNVKVTAHKWNGTAVAPDTSANGYSGNKTVVWSGLANSPDGTTPTYPTTGLNFSAGTTTANNLNVTAVDAGAATLAVTEGARNGSASFTVAAAGPALRFTSGTPSCDSGSVTINTAGATFTAKVSRDEDTYGNAATFSGTATVTLSPTNKGTFSPATVSFANNGAKETGAFTYTPSGNGNVTLTATATGYVGATCLAKQ